MDFFSFENYAKILNQMSLINKIYSFNLVDSNVKNGFILRHDVDFNIEKAYELSNVEKEMQITSTYFLLVSSDLYNVSSFKNRSIIKTMSCNGFEIGLHFDLSVYQNIDLNEMYKKVEKECFIIEDITGIKIQSISLHTPSIYGMYPIFRGYLNAYSEEYFKPDLYLSDSCKNFRGKDVFKFIKSGKENLLQILFHPIHFSQNGETYVESFNKIIETRINNFDNYVRLNKTYKKEIEDKTLLECFIKYVKEKNING